jgi:hypothetical protein
MNTQPTPRTDANDLGWQFNEQYGDFDSLSDTPMPWLDFAKMLERELAAVTEQRNRLAEALRLIAEGTSCRECGGEDQALFARQSLQSMICDALQSLTPKSEL